MRELYDATVVSFVVVVVVVDVVVVVVVESLTLSATTNWNTLNDNSTVTPGNKDDTCRVNYWQHHGIYLDNI